jgi:protoporphyrinogen/coproporphyrinogen III oxidase
MIGIIGAGISGLALAYYLQKANKTYFILEASNFAGGYLQSERKGAYLYEKSANSLLADQTLVDVLHDIGLQDQLLYANEVSKKRYVLKNGKYAALPSSPLQLLTNNFFSWKTKFAIFKELQKPTQSIENETISDFFARRFSQELVDYAVNPFVTGIYAGNPAELLVEKTFPQLLDYEKQYGSVLKGFMKNKGGGRKLSINFLNGLETLPKKMAESLQVFYNTKVTNITYNKKFTIATSNQQFDCQKLVIAVPSFHAAPFLQGSFPAFASALENLHYPPMKVVHTVLKKSALGFELNGFGGLHPQVEGKFSAGALWTSSVFAHRCPDDEVLLTSFVGGRLGAENTKLPDEQLLQKLNKELQELYKLSQVPVYQGIVSWEKAIPQYDKAMIETDKLATEAAKNNLFVCANWHKGISLADAFKKGKLLAESL